jgi:hypothetical protein
VHCAIVAIAIFAWLAISNHCAISAVATKGKIAQSSCPFHSKPAKQKPGPSGIECCKVLRAVFASGTKNLAPTTVALVDFDRGYGRHTVFAPAKIFFAPESLDTGPPGKTSFVELNRSMRAQAPPRGA